MPRHVTPDDIGTDPRRSTHPEAPALQLRPHPGLPAAGVLHVLDARARIAMQDGLLRVERPEEPPHHYRLAELRALSIQGSASITTPCIQVLLEAGVPILWRSLSGYYLGQTAVLSGEASRRRRAQYRAQGAPLGTAIAVRLIAAKVANMRAALRRRQGGAHCPVRAAVQALDRLAAQVEAATDLDLLRGLEGAATARYFGCWSQLLQSRGGLWPFTARRRRPPPDGVNALISYCSAVVAGECAVAALAAGLDATEGFLHTARAGRPALALDLVEPFRPAVAESVALALLNTGEIGPDHIVTEAGRASLTAAGRRTVLAALERRLASPAPGGGTERDWRSAIGAAGRSLAEALVADRADRVTLPVQR